MREPPIGFRPNPRVKAWLGHQENKNKSMNSALCFFLDKLEEKEIESYKDEVVVARVHTEINGEYWKDYFAYLKILSDVEEWRDVPGHGLVNREGRLKLAGLSNFVVLDE